MNLSRWVINYSLASESPLVDCRSPKTSDGYQGASRIILLLNGAAPSLLIS